jgi:predicted SprT family Zn-dependent metalloprotease
MNLEDAENLALTLMEDHGIGNTWSFRFDNAKRRCGSCHHGKRTITLSRHFVERNTEADVDDTIRHEIAHALAGHKAGHGVQWQMWAIRLGARPQRCAENVDMPEGGIEGVCAPDCTVRHTRHRMPPKRLADAYSCSRCYAPVTWVRVK